MIILNETTMIFGVRVGKLKQRLLFTRSFPRSCTIEHYLYVNVYVWHWDINWYIQSHHKHFSAPSTPTSIIRSVKSCTDDDHVMIPQFAQLSSLKNTLNAISLLCVNENTRRGNTCHVHFSNIIYVLYTIMKNRGLNWTQHHVRMTIMRDNIWFEIYDACASNYRGKHIGKILSTGGLTRPICEDDDEDVGNNENYKQARDLSRWDRDNNTMYTFFLLSFLSYWLNRRWCRCTNIRSQTPSRPESTESRSPSRR